MAVLVSVPDFRVWAGANTPASISDDLIQTSLEEAESGIAAETGATIIDIQANASATAIARGDEMRRASRLLARRNSPEGIAGAGSEGVISIPSRDPDSAASVRQIRAILLVPEGVA